MIIRLTNTKEQTAKQIHDVFQRSYRIEADIIGVKEFPPLSRTIVDIMGSTSEFFGFNCGGNTAGVIEVELRDGVLDIHSLTVNPDFFRRGIAGQLMTFVVDNFEANEMVVETALSNEPAIKLYVKHGFRVYRQWIPEHGIEKVALIRKNA